MIEYKAGIFPSELTKPAQNSQAQNRKEKEQKEHKRPRCGEPTACQAHDYHQDEQRNHHSGGNFMPRNPLAPSDFPGNEMEKQQTQQKERPYNQIYRELK
jgi:hypothetical protein